MRDPFFKKLIFIKRYEIWDMRYEIDMKYEIW